MRSRKPERGEGERRAREESGRKWRRARRIDTRGEASRVRSAGWFESFNKTRTGTAGIARTPNQRPKGAGFRENAKETLMPGWRRKVLRGT
jgi:hypothetical protein